MPGIYVASRSRHAALWRAFRSDGYPIVSTWIDEAGRGETKDWRNLWKRCIREASEADVCVFYVEPGDFDGMTGALLEVGSALGAGCPVLAVGPLEGSFQAHPLMTRFARLVEALDRAVGVIEVLSR